MSGVRTLYANAHYRASLYLQGYVRLYNNQSGFLTETGISLPSLMKCVHCLSPADPELLFIYDYSFFPQQIYKKNFTRIDSLRTKRVIHEIKLKWLAEIPFRGPKAEITPDQTILRAHLSMERLGYGTRVFDIDSQMHFCPTITFVSNDLKKLIRNDTIIETLQRNREIELN